MQASSPTLQLTAKGYELGKKPWVARLERPDEHVAGVALRYIAAGDKQLAEQIILKKQSRDPNNKLWNHLLAEVYHQVLVGSQGPLQGGFIRSVSLRDAHGLYADSIRRRQYVERGIALQPDSRSAQVHRVMLQRMDSYRKLTEVMRRGSGPDDLVKNGTDEDRLYVLPTLIRSDIYAGGSVVAEDRTRDYLALVKQHSDHARFNQALFEANMYIGKLALHRGDRKTAVRLLVAAVDSPGSAELRFMQIDMTLARSLVDWGEREAVAKFLDRCAQINRESDKYKLWAADIRKGINPDLIPYTTG